VQRAGHKQESIETLGWGEALEMYRPLLSYDELGHILEGTPSQFYDQLHRLLGLEQLVEAMQRLESEVKQLKVPAAQAKQARDELRLVLEAHEDPRAAVALAQVKKYKPNLEAVRPLITEGAGSPSSPSWRQAERLVVPTTDEVQQKVTALREAPTRKREEAGHSDALVTAYHAFAQGRSRSDVESAWEAAQKVSKRIALALSLDADNYDAVEKWIGNVSSRRRTLSAVNKGVHKGVFNAKGVVDEARSTVGDLAAVAK
jgi:hypothetical protein